MQALAYHADVTKTPAETDRGQIHLSFRVDADLVRRLDEHAKRMEAERPGIKVNRTDAVRALLIEAMDARDAKPRRKK